MRSISILALGAPLVSAIAFSNPAANSTLTKGAEYDLQWTSVDTDPTTFSVYLVNFVNWPPYYTSLAQNVETSTGETTVRVPCDIDDSYGFQFNAINGTNVYVIYSQTPKFSITGDACTDAVTTAAASSCAAAPTVTQTVTVRGNSTLLSASSTSNSSAPATTAAAVAGNELVAKDTFHGTCPATIGWGGDYSHPVTLTETPRADRTVATATGYAAATTLAKPAEVAASASASASAAAALEALTQEKVSKGASGSKCAKKAKKLKRHSDNDLVSPMKRAKRALAQKAQQQAQQ